MLNTRCILSCQQKVFTRVSSCSSYLATICQLQTRHHQKPIIHYQTPTTIGRLGKLRKNAYVKGTGKDIPGVYKHAYSVAELNEVVDYDAFIKDMEKSIKTLKRTYLKIPEKIEQKILLRDDSERKLSVTLQNLLVLLSVQTRDGRCKMIELVQVNEVHTDMLVIKLQQTVYLKELLEILVESEMRLHPRVDVSNNQEYTIYIAMTKSMEIQDKSLAKVNEIGEKILDEMNKRRGYCVGRTKKKDTLPELFNEVYERIQKVYETYVNNAKFIIESERQRWDWRE